MSDSETFAEDSVEDLDANIERLFFRDAARAPLLGRDGEQDLALEIEREELAIWRAAFRIDRRRAISVATVALSAPRADGVGTAQTSRRVVPPNASARAIRDVDADRFALAAVASDVRLCSPAAQRRWCDLRNRFIAANMRYAVVVARRYPEYHSPSRLDLLQEACVGMLRALGRFDPRLGYKFSTYSTHWINHSIKRWLQDRRRTIRVPSHLQSRRGSTTLDLSTWKDANRRARLYAGPDVSLHAPAWAPTDEGGETTLGDILPSGDISPEEEAARSVEAAVVRRTLSVLTPRERVVVRGRFFEDKTLEHLGEMLGLTRERVRQIEAKALRKIRKRAEKLGLFLGF